MMYAMLRAATLCAAALLAFPPALATPPSAIAATPPTLEDCEVTDGLVAREACFAGLPDPVIDDCESLRLFRCAPYRDMHLARLAHVDALDRLIVGVQDTLADYAGSGSAHANELVDSLRAAESAWQAWRDAECAVIPLLEGMARDEATGLTEACRADQTRSRADLLRVRAADVQASTP